MSSELWASIIGGVTGIVGACIGAWFTLWLQSRNERIKMLDDRRLYVELSAVKRDEEGYFIPGYGRILQTWDESSGSNPLHQMPEVKKRKGKVALICHDRTPADSTVPYYVIGRIMPL